MKVILHFSSNRYKMTQVNRIILIFLEDEDKGQSEVQMLIVKKMHVMKLKYHQIQEVPVIYWLLMPIDVQMM